MTEEVEICKECNTPILAGDPVHGVLHIHWKCYERFGQAVETLDRLLSRPKLDEEPPPPDPNAPVERCRANGGHLFHWVRVGHMVALCGQTPFNHPRARMRPRGRWIRNVTPFNKSSCCKKCDAVLGN